MSTAPDLATSVLVPIDPAGLRPLDPGATTEPVSEARAAQEGRARAPLTARAALLRRVVRGIVVPDDRAPAGQVTPPLRAGSVWHIDHAYVDGAMQAPWGGHGASGIGRTHGREGHVGLSRVKLTDSARHLPPDYPYSEAVVDGFRGVLGGLHGAGPRARIAAPVRHRAGIVHLVRKAFL